MKEIDHLEERKVQTVFHALAIVALCSVIVILASCQSGCRSLGGAKQVGFQGFAVAHTSLMLTRSVEKGLVCGLPTAPLPPLCVDDATHGKILGILRDGFKLDDDLGAIVQATPEGVPLPAQVGELVGRITVLVADVVALIPKSPARQALAEKVAPSAR